MNTLDFLDANVWLTLPGAYTYILVIRQAKSGN